MQIRSHSVTWKLKIWNTEIRVVWKTQEKYPPFDLVVFLGYWELDIFSINWFAIEVGSEPINYVSVSLHSKQNYRNVNAVVFG